MQYLQVSYCYCTSIINTDYGIFFTPIRPIDMRCDRWYWLLTIDGLYKDCKSTVRLIERESSPRSITSITRFDHPSPLVEALHITLYVELAGEEKWKEEQARGIAEGKI